MKLHILGSLSGTEPFPGRHHTSVALETGSGLYFFDAGENCSHTAYNMGLDLRDIRHIFITHPHVDHTGGLANLLWTVGKLHWVNHDTRDLRVVCHTPQQETMDGVKAILQQGAPELKLRYTLDWRRVVPGVQPDLPELLVEARPSTHVPKLPDGSSRAFSYRVTVPEGRIVISGDLGDLSDLGDWLDDCDLLLMETGHHLASEICARIRREKHQVRHIVFYHHGREMLDDPAGAVARARAAWDGEVIIAEDAMTIDFPSCRVRSVRK